ncbi:MAG TPA: hypothetical protein VG269_02170 [Tepidisphaeraceae bacterium]|jgi:hypothetical protein|nr:hypothetical protein [Tepidisphaeraceae bacterium]
MSRVFVSEATGAVIYVFADDHCPPHVHARHRGEGWIARVGFSYVDHEVALISIAPLRNVPLQRVVNELLDDIQARLTDCRRSWWRTRQTTCLANQWALTPAAGAIELHPDRTRGAKQIADAVYDPATERLRVTFRDRTTTEVSARP